MTAIHLTIVAVLGLWVWFHTSSEPFGGDDCTQHVTYAIFSRDVPITSRKLNHISKAAYFLTLVPLLNVWIFWTMTQPVAGPLLFSISIGWMILVEMDDRPPKWLPERIRQNMKRRGKARDDDENMTIGMLYLISLIVPFIIQVYFIVVTERMIRSNTPLLSGGDEEQWTFGQTLAVGITVIPLLEIYKLIWSRLKGDRRKGKGRVVANTTSSSLEPDTVERWRNDLPATSGLIKRRNSI